MLRTIAKETGPIQVNTYLNIMSTNILSRMILNKRFLAAAGDQNVYEIHEFIEIINEGNFCFSAIHLQDVFNFIPKWLDPQGLDASLELAWICSTPTWSISTRSCEGAIPSPKGRRQCLMCFWSRFITRNLSLKST